MRRPAGGAVGSRNSQDVHFLQKHVATMFKGQDFLKAKFSEVSAKTISLSGKTFARGRNEKKVRTTRRLVPELALNSSRSNS